VAYQFIAEEIRKHGKTDEVAVQQRIMRHFQENGLTTYSPPIVGRGPHSADPHYETNQQENFEIRPGDFVLIDLWAKLNRPLAVYSDLTQVCYIGDNVPAHYTNVFNVVAAARDAGIQLVRDRFAAKKPLQGWEVDDAVRNVIDQAGYGEFFVHRTGHNIGQEVHGNGAHMDNLETREERYVLPRTCFSIEPGIYLPEFGVRSEVDVYVDHAGGVHVTGGQPQTQIQRIIV
jgi:Xaa-Pro dipeptidase